MGPGDVAIVIGQLVAAFLVGRALLRSSRRALGRAAFAAALSVAVVHQVCFRDAAPLVAALRSPFAPALLDATPTLVGLMCAYGVAGAGGGWRRVAYPTVALAALAAWGVLGRCDVAERGSARWSGEVCLQSKPTSCGPAGVATFLRAVGTAAEEADLFDDCLTTRSGTGLAGLLRGVLRHRPDARLERWVTGPATVARLPLPCLCPVVLTAQAQAREPRYADEWGWAVGQRHVVVVFAREGDAVVVGDPAVGRERWPLATFLDLWSGTAISVPRGAEAAVGP